MRAFLHSFRYAFAGVAYVLRTQRNARVHAAVAGAVIVAGIGLHISAVEWAVILLCMGLVFSAEMLNTVAELAVNLLTQRHDPLAKVAKDAAAGAVLIAAIASVGVGIVIFGPRLWHLIAVR